jgi:hypothetical protein
MRQTHHVGRMDEAPRRRPACDHRADRGRTRPNPILLSAALMAMLAIIPGCKDRHDSEGRLVPYLDANGRLSYYYEGEFPDTSPIPVPVPVSPPQYVVASGRGDDEAYREMIAYRRNQQEQIERDRQERQYQQSLEDAASRHQRERARLEQHAQWERDNDGFLQRREQRDREAAARTQQMIDDQTRWLRMQPR